MFDKYKTRHSTFHMDIHFITDIQQCYIEWEEWELKSGMKLAYICLHQFSLVVVTHLPNNINKKWLYNYVGIYFNDTR